jgi:AraC-like DNA-binding protein
VDSGDLGRPTDEEIENLLTSTRVQAQRGERHAALFDCSLFEEKTTEDTRRRRQLLEARHAMLSGCTTRNALVCPANATPPLFAQPFDADVTRAPRSANQTFVDFELALDWVEPTLTPDLRAGIRTIRAHATATHALLTRLKQLFSREDVSQVDVSFAARHLGTSRRSLQRALAQQGTSFRAELNQTRIERAKRELNRGASVTSLAFELGFQNVQSFIRVFKQATGVTPGAWRRGDSVPSGDIAVEGAG